MPSIKFPLENHLRIGNSSLWLVLVGSVGSVSASHTVGREFASRPGHTKDHHENGTNCLPA